MKPHKKTPAKHQSHLMMEHIDISVTINHDIAGQSLTIPDNS